MSIASAININLVLLLPDLLSKGEKRNMCFWCNYDLISANHCFTKQEKPLQKEVFYFINNEARYSVL